MRPVMMVFSKLMNLFQLTHSQGVRLVVPCGKCLLCRVSTHALARSATGDDIYYMMSLFEFQLTHSQGVRRGLGYRYCDDMQVSTHALARSATSVRIGILRIA